MSSKRPKRLAEAIRREISSLLVNGVKDPRLGMVTVMDVTVTGDLRYAKVYISSFESPERVENSMKALEKATGFIRRELGKQIRLRNVPELSFHYDDTPDKAMYLTEVINKVRREDEAVNIEENDDD
jgi:ribosome-binding factor A